MTDPAPEETSGSPQPLIPVPENQEPGTPIPGAQTTSYSDLNPEDPLYVPVVNVNYVPAGIDYLEGFVPDTPGDDKVLNRIKQALEAQGHESGPVEEPPVEPVSETEPASEPVETTL